MSDTVFRDTAEIALDEHGLLRALAARLFDDPEIRVDVGPRPWSWDPFRRIVSVPASDVAAPDWARIGGLMAHEAAHAFITRWPLLRLPAFPSAIACRLLFSSLEETRVDVWARRRFPEHAPGLQRAHDELRSGALTHAPSFAVFCWEVVRAPGSAWVLPRGVSRAEHRALCWTLPARRRVAQEHVPPADLATVVPSACGLELDYDCWVRPKLRDHERGAPDRVERAVRWWAVSAVAQAQDILDAGRALILGDVAAIHHWLAATPARIAIAEATVARRTARAVDALMQAIVRERRARASGFLRVASEWIRRLGAGQDPPAPATWFLAWRLLEAYLELVLGAKMDEIATSPPLGELEHERTEPEYHESDAEIPQLDHAGALAAVRGRIDELTRVIGRSLRERRRTRFVAGSSSGHRVHLPAAMQVERDPVRTAVWLRRVPGLRVDSAWYLLIDLSGSMRGAKCDAALCGAVLMVEALARLGIPVAVSGFQDVLIPLVRFGDDPLKRTAGLNELPLEVGGTRPGGNNKPAYNDDGPCLLSAAAELEQHPARERFLVVVSDGLPAGARSDAADLKRAVMTVSARRTCRLIGIGLGEGTLHVRDFYPEAIGDVRVDDLATELGALLRRATRPRRGRQTSRISASLARRS